MRSRVWPTASSALCPKSASAPGFHRRITPAPSAKMMASGAVQSALFPIWRPSCKPAILSLWIDDLGGDAWGFAPAPLAPNARFQALPEAGARHERRLEAVACKPLLGRTWQGHRTDSLHHTQRLKTGFLHPLIGG